MDSVYGWSIRLMMAGTLLCAVFGSVGGVCDAATLPEYAVKRCTGKIVLDGFHEAGSHSVRWDDCDDWGCPESSGTCLVYLREDGRESSRKILLMK